MSFMYHNLDKTTVKRDKKDVTKVLVKWKHQLQEDARWKFFHDQKKMYPSFNP